MTWSWDASHFPTQVTRAFGDLYCASAEQGFAAGAERYGLSLTGWEVRADDGWIFTRVLPTIAAAQVNRRESAALATTQELRWMNDATHWRERERGEVLVALRRLADVDLASMSRAAFADHLDAVAALARAGVARHFELHLADMIPLGRLLVAATEHSIATDDVLVRCAGLSPSSRLTSDLPGTTVIGRVDVDAPRLADLLDLASTAASTSPRPAGAPIPWGDPTLDELLDEVSATFWLRDDNASLLLAAPVGLVGLAMLEAARRFDIPHAAVVDATCSEISARLRGDPAASTDDLLAPALSRRGATMPPPSGSAHSPVEDHTRNGGPTSVALTDALLACDALYERDEPCGVGSRTVRGRAVIGVTPDQVLDALDPDAVLIVRATSPAFDPAMALCCAVVCESGGPLSHAALAARELDIPAVIGLRGATSAIPDGAWVEVDPVRCTVRVVAPPESSGGPPA